MALIQRGDLVEKLRDQFGVVQGQVGATLSDELVGVIIVDDVSGPDVVSTQHPVTAIGSSSSASAVGFLSKVGLQNPTGSGMDIFLESITISLEVDRDYTIRRGVIAASPNAGVQEFKDSRVDGNPVGLIWDENGTGSLGTLIWEVRGLAQLQVVVPLGLTLQPTDSVHVQEISTNSSIPFAGFQWTERIRRE